MQIIYTDDDFERFGQPIAIICYDHVKDELRFQFPGDNRQRSQEYLAIIKKFITVKGSISDVEGTK